MKAELPGGCVVALETPYLIVANGCDDHTPVLLHLTATELASVRRVARAINEAVTAHCQPHLHLYHPVPCTGCDGTGWEDKEDAWACSQCRGLGWDEGKEVEP